MFLEEMSTLNKSRLKTFIDNSNCDNYKIYLNKILRIVSGVMLRVTILCRCYEPFFKLWSDKEN